MPLNIFCRYRICDANCALSSMRTADAFPVVASHLLGGGEKRRPEMRLLFVGYALKRFGRECGQNQCPRISTSGCCLTARVEPRPLQRLRRHRFSCAG